MLGDDICQVHGCGHEPPEGFDLCPLHQEIVPGCIYDLVPGPGDSEVYHDHYRSLVVLEARDFERACRAESLPVYRRPRRLTSV